MNVTPCRNFLSFMQLLWIAILASFVVVHAPKDKIEIVCQQGVDFASEKADFIKNIITDKGSAVWALTKLAVRLKKIVFLISMAVILPPVIGSLKRTSFLWEPQNIRKRIITSGILFLLLSALVLPVTLAGSGASYARMSLSPFEMNFGWSYRRLLLPAIAYFLGFQGNFLFYVFSLLVVFILIYLVIAYFEFERVEINLIDLLSIMTSSFVIFNFMVQGFADSLMFIIFLIAVIATDTHESRLAVVALGLLVHEASAFILAPLALCFFPRKDAYGCFLVIAAYLMVFMLSLTLNVDDFLNTHIVVQADKTAFEWIKQYPFRALGGWLASYKLLWIVIVYGTLQMFRYKDHRKGLCVISIGVISPLVINLLTLDVSRHIGWGSLALLLSYSYLMTRGYGKTLLMRCVMLVNIIIPSIYVGTNAGFRSDAAGVYHWLYEASGLNSLLAVF